MKTDSEMETLGPVGKLNPAIDLPQNSGDWQQVMELVNRCGAWREDDAPEEAATRLASMALLLANIAAGHLRCRVDGADFDLGVDFAVEGGMAAAEFESSLIGKVAWIQDRWERNLLHDVGPDGPGGDEALTKEKRVMGRGDSLTLPLPRARRMFHHSQLEHLGRTMEKKGAGANGVEDLDGIDDTDDGLMEGEEIRPEPGKPEPRKYQNEPLMPLDMVSLPLILWRRPTLWREAAERPVFFAATAAPAGLQSRAARAHLGHLLVHVRIDSAASLETLRKSLAEFAERGTFAEAGGSPRVRANLALCANSGVLDEAVAADGEQLVSRLLWLVQSAPGCELPGTVERIPECPAPDFRAACEKEIRRRINFTDEDVHELDALNGRMGGWRRFLRERERHLPGIAAVALNLPAALCYGLQALLRHSGKVDGDEVVTFAKWLVIRMSNRIAAAAMAGQDREIERRAARIAEKLSLHGPMKIRDLQRRFSRLSAGDCRSALEWLADHRVAAEQDGKWGILGESRGFRELIKTGGD